EKVLAEYERHPIGLPLDRAYSPAAIGKAYLRAMGISLPQIVVPPELGLTVDGVQGRAMTAYFGGRAECRIRKVPVPIVYCDFLSMYPTVNTLMGLWRYLIAERVVVEDATEHVQALVARVTADDLVEPAIWQELPALVEVEPDEDILPLRTRYDAASPT